MNEAPFDAAGRIHPFFDKAKRFAELSSDKRRGTGEREDRRNIEGLCANGRCDALSRNERTK
jgi:hypothetical protein